MRSFLIALLLTLLSCEAQAAVYPYQMESTDTEADEECLTYEATGDKFEWQACGSGGHSNGANCSAGQYPLGVDENGAVESCTADDDLPDADEVTEAMLKAVDTASDEECLTYEVTTGDFEWQACGSAHGDGANCATGEIPLGVDANGAVQSCYEPAFTDVTGAVTDAQVPNTITIDLAATATALAANGGNCGAGNYPLGVDASGAVESCTADDDLPDADEVTEAMLKAVDAASDEECLTYEVTTGDFEWQACGDSAHGDGANCAAGEIPLGVDAAGAVQGCYEPAFTDVTGSVTDAQVPNTITIDVATTATALAANGGNCTAGNYPLGVDASGAVESCTAAPTGEGTTAGDLLTLTGLDIDFDGVQFISSSNADVGVFPGVKLGADFSTTTNNGCIGGTEPGSSCATNGDCAGSGTCTASKQLGLSGHANFIRTDTNSTMGSGIKIDAGIGEIEAPNTAGGVTMDVDGEFGVDTTNHTWEYRSGGVDRVVYPGSQGRFTLHYYDGAISLSTTTVYGAINAADTASIFGTVVFGVAPATFTCDALYVKLGSNMPASATLTVGLRDQTAGSDMINCDVAAASSSCNDTATSDTIDAGDQMNFRIVCVGGGCSGTANLAVSASCYYH